MGKLYGMQVCRAMRLERWLIAGKIEGFPCFLILQIPPSTHLSLPSTVVSCYKWPEKGIRYPGAVVTNGCEP